MLPLNIFQNGFNDKVSCDFGKFKKNMFLYKKKLFFRQVFTFGRLSLHDSYGSQNSAPDHKASRSILVNLDKVRPDLRCFRTSKRDWSNENFYSR